MKSRRRKNGVIQLSFHSDENDTPVYFRLCHHCSHVNEAPQDIERCAKCRRPLNFAGLLDEMDAEEIMEMTMDEDFDQPDNGGEGAGTSNHSFRTEGLSEELQGDDEDYPTVAGLNVIW